MTKFERPQNPSRRMACGTILLGTVYLVGKAYAVDEPQTAPSYFLLPANFDIDNLDVAPPPADDLAEAQLVLAMQSHRTGIQVAQIKDQANNPIPLFWRCAGLDEASHPQHAKRIQEAVVDAEYVVTVFKRRFNRRRPSSVLPEIHPVVPVPAYASYPSGHATQSVVIAALMSELAPKASNKLQALATQVGRNREIAGVHYPSDTDAGFKLGHDLARMFQADNPRKNGA